MRYQWRFLYYIIPNLPAYLCRGMENAQNRHKRSPASNYVLLDRPFPHWIVMAIHKLESSLLFFLISLIQNRYRFNDDFPAFILRSHRSPVLVVTFFIFFFRAPLAVASSLFTYFLFKWNAVFTADLSTAPTPRSPTLFFTSRSFLFFLLLLLFPSFSELFDLALNSASATETEFTFGFSLASAPVDWELHFSVVDFFVILFCFWMCALSVFRVHYPARIPFLRFDIKDDGKQQETRRRRKEE